MPSRSHKKKLAATVLAKRKGPKKEEKINPFEVRVNKKKHEVLGQKSKSDRGLPGVARSKAVKKRKNTLLVEYQQRNKANQFVDRRFGEYNDELSVEEKMMQRFTLERKRKHERSSVFNLEDNEEGLTHYGQSIGDMERFDHIELSEDEGEEEDIGETHFGGFLRKKRKIDDEEDGDKLDSRQRSRKEIMEEVVAKSKAMKYKQQSERQGVEEMLDKINNEWKSVKDLLSVPNERGQKSHGDDYDRTVRELAFEKRGQPTDRLKTEKEIAKEEKMKLEKLEADRMRRMKGMLSISDDLVTESADYINDKPPTKKKVQFTLRYKDGKIVLPLNVDSHDSAADGGRLRSGPREDNVSDSDGGSEGSEADEGEGEIEEECDFSGGSEDSEGGDSGDAGGDSEEECDSADSGGESEDEECDGSDPSAEYGSDLESDISEDESLVEKTKIKQSILKGPSQEEVEKIKELASKELPYTFTVPKSLEELKAIVTDRSPAECLTAVERIHSCNHPSIDPANKQKLEAFLPVFVDYYTSLVEGATCTRECVDTLDHMAKPLFKLSQLNPRHTAEVFRTKVQLSRELWLTVRGRKGYPPLSELLLFKLIAVVFPTSDFKHPVTTPTLLHMGQLLTKCQVKSVNDLLSGLLLCQIVLEYLSLSKRFMPELVNFLTSAVGCFVEARKGVRFSPLTGKSTPLFSTLTEDSSEDSMPPLFSVVIEEQQSSQASKVIESYILKCALLSVSRLVELYSDLPSFSELFAPLVTNMQCILERTLPSSIEQSLAETLELISSRGSKEKPVLQFLKQKPKSIKFYEPKFDEIYEVNRKKARSKAAGEKQKLRHKVKKETKGAIREIRRDAAFLAKEKLSEKLMLDAERAAKTKRILNDLQMGQHEAKQERRKKRR